MIDDGMLSQEEIDALLNINEEKDGDNSDEKLESNVETTYLSSIEKDAIGEIGNISLGSSATTLSTLLNNKVNITTPSVTIVRKTGLKEEFPYEHVSLQVSYVEGFDGKNIFLLKAKDAAVISDVMLGGSGEEPKEELTDIELSAVQEAMNQMMGASATSMSTIFNKKIDISPPTVEYENIDQIEEVKNYNEEDVFVKVEFQLQVGNLIDSKMMQLIPLKFAKRLIDELMSKDNETTSINEEEIIAQDTIELEEVTVNEKFEDISNVDEFEQESTALNEKVISSTGTTTANNNVKKASFSSFKNVSLTKQNERNLEMLLDIQLQVAVQLGKTKKTVKEILDLTQGSVVELDKLAGEPVDVLVNNKMIAKGEVVVIDENFGVRITDVISQEDRLMNLN